MWLSSWKYNTHWWWWFIHQFCLFAARSPAVQGDTSGSTPAFVDFDFQSYVMFPRCSAISATFAAAQADSGSSEIMSTKARVWLDVTPCTLPAAINVSPNLSTLGDKWHGLSMLPENPIVVFMPQLSSDFDGTNLLSQSQQLVPNWFWDTHLLPSQFSPWISSVTKYRHSIKVEVDRGQFQIGFGLPLSPSPRSELKA